MPLLDFVMVLVIVGVLLYLVNRFVPMEPSIKSILNAVVVIAVVFWVLALFLHVGSLSTIRIGR